MKPIKQSITINFAQGLDTKTDPKQIQIGNFLSLDNSVFTTGAQLTKRNGFAELAGLPSSNYSYLTTFNGNLTAIGSNIAAYDEPNLSWIQKGSIQPLSLKTLPLLRNNFNQTACDSAIASNGLVCTAYLEYNGTATVNKYVIADSTTGQIISAPIIIPVGSGAVSGGMRVFTLGIYFIIVFTNTISATTHLQYIAININNTNSISANTDIANSYQSSSGLSWDGYSTGQYLYIAYSSSSGGQAVYLTRMATNLGLQTPTSFSGFHATLMSVTLDTSLMTPQVYVTFKSSVGSNVFTAITDQNLNLIMTPIDISETAPLNITSAALNGTCYVFLEYLNNYSYDTSIPSHYINLITITPSNILFTSVFSSGASSITASSVLGLQANMYLADNTTSSNLSYQTQISTISGMTLNLSEVTAGNSASSPGDTLTAAFINYTPTTVIRSCGLASKAFIVQGVVYFLAAYQSPYQPTYFLINGSLSTENSPIVAAKLAYSNGGGYLTTGLPGVSVSNDIAQVPYLYKDLIQAVNKNTNVAAGTQTAGIYSQLGINLATFDFGTQGLDSVEIGLDLHLTGGFLWMYDGQIPIEHNFFLWPDSIEGSYTENPVTPTGSWSNGAISITVSSASGIAVGMQIADTSNSTYIPAGTIVTAISGTTVTISKATTHSATNDNLSISGFMAAQPDGSTNTKAYYYQVTYEWTDNQGNAFRSAPSIPISITTAGSDTTGSVVLDIPTLRLTYKIASPVKIVIYRWSVAQQIYYQTTSILQPLLNDTTVDFVTYTDVNSDATILGNNIIYTNGGVIEDINAPASNLLTLFDDRLWLVDAEDPNLLWFSKQVIETTPVEMSDLFTFYVAPSIGAEGSTGVITATAAMDDKLIIFKKNAIYYINGTGPDNTGANSQYSQPIFITSTVGCSNQYSIVFMPQGLMFQSDKGIWLLGRDLSTTYIGANVEKYNSQTVMSAQNIPGTNQVRFLMSGGMMLMYDYYYGQWGRFNGVAGISSTIYNQLHTFINSRGSTYQESPGIYLDGSNPVLMSFQTGPLKLGELQNFQRTFFYYLLGSYITPHQLLLSNYYDYSTTPTETALYTPPNFGGSWGSIGPWGQPTPWGGTQYLIENFRVFTNRRCMALSIGLQEIYDPSFGVAAGAGFTLSGINLICGFKAPFRSQSVYTSVGSQG